MRMPLRVIHLKLLTQFRLRMPLRVIHLKLLAKSAAHP